MDVVFFIQNFGLHVVEPHSDCPNSHKIGAVILEEPWEGGGKGPDAAVLLRHLGFLSVSLEDNEPPVNSVEPLSKPTSSNMQGESAAQRPNVGASYQIS